jgi:hypothetical protein
MARYNSVNTIGSILGGSTISTPASGLLTTITSAGTTFVPIPALYTGSTQTIYNASGSTITLSTNSNGNFIGAGASGSTTIILANASIITIVSDGANYVVQGFQGGPISTTTLSASGAVTFNPTNASISIQPTGTGIVTIASSTGNAGTIDNMNIGATTQGSGKFTSLEASGIAKVTTSTAATLGTTGTGALQVTGGASVGGILNVGSTLYVGGTTNTINATNPTSWVSVNTALTTQSMYMQVNTTSTDTRIGSYTSHNLGIYTNNTVRMTFDTSGNVGVGTTSPKAQLQSSGAAQTNSPTLGSATGAGLYVTNTDQAYGLIAGVSSNGNAWLQVQRTDAGATSYNLNLQPSGGNVGIGNTSPAVILDMSTKTDAIALPKGTTAQRPTGAAGYMRYNTTLNSVEFYKASESIWVGLGLLDGSSASNAAPSGQYIATNFPSFTSGYYWIKSSAMPTALKMYVDMTEESGGYDFYAFQGTGTAVSYITDTHSGKALGLELVMPRSKYHWRAMRNYVTNVLGSSDYTYFANVAGIYRSTGSGSYTGYIMRNPTSYGSGAPDWRVLDGGRWWLRDTTYSEPNGDYTINGFLGDMARGSFTSGTYALGDLLFNDGATYTTGAYYLVSTNAKA